MSDFGMLHEHEGAPISDDASSDLADLNVPPPSDDEEKLIKLVNRLFTKSKQHRAKFDFKWVDYYQMFRGDQWKNKRPSYRHAEVINFIFMHISSVVPQMLDARPRSFFIPQDPSDLEFSEVLNDLYEADAQKGNWLMKIAETLFDGHFYGTGFGSLRFDPTLDYGMGRILHDSEDPFEMYPDPEARDVNDERFSHYIIQAEPRDVEKLRQKYSAHPSVGAIRPDLMDFTKRDERSAFIPKAQFNRLTDKKLPAESFGGDDRSLTDKVMVFTAYIKPADVVEEAEQTQDPMGKVTIRYISKKKYPKGRRVVMINNRIFEDGPLENDDLKFPYMRYTNYLDPRQFWGISEIEPLESPQKIFNKLMSFVLDVLTLAGNPVWVIPTSSGVKPGSFHNAPGMQIPYDGPTPPQRMEGAQLQPYVIQMIDRMAQYFNDVSGSQDVTRGVNPASVTAAAAIENLQQAAQTRTKQKMRNLDAYLTQLGEQYVQLVLQHYTEPRIFRLTNKKGLDKYFRFHVEHQRDIDGRIMLDEKGDPIRIAVVKTFDKDDEGSSSLENAEEKRFLIRGAFDVKVNTQTGLPFVKGEREQKLLQLYDRQIIDREEVLKGMEYPNAEAVLERVAAKEKQAAEMAAMGG